MELNLKQGNYVYCDRNPTEGECQYWIVKKITKNEATKLIFHEGWGLEVKENVRVKF